MDDRTPAVKTYKSHVSTFHNEKLEKDDLKKYETSKKKSFLALKKAENS